MAHTSISKTFGAWLNGTDQALKPFTHGALYDFNNWTNIYITVMKIILTPLQVIISIINMLSVSTLEVVQH